MSIKPIDLQSLFVKMSEVSKEQALIKELSVRQQNQAANVQINKELEEDRRVTQSPEDRELDSIKDDESENRRDSSKHSQEENAQGAAVEKNRTVIKDEDVGQNIDLTG